MLRAQPQANAANLLEDWETVQAAFTRCDEQLEERFFQAMEDFRAENENRCNVQERNARDYAQRRRQMLEDRLQRFQEQGQTRIIPATEGQLAKLERELAVKLKTVDERRDIEDQILQLAAGLVWVTETS